MKIVAGLGSIDEYIKFAEAGADEFFCGYVPYSWSQKYGTVLPPVSYTHLTLPTTPYV